MARVVFIQPAAEFDAYAFFRLPLLGPLYLGTLLRQQGHAVRVLTESRRHPVVSDGRLHPALAEADVVGLSAMTCTAPRAYWIADQVRRRRPGTRIVLGGPHSTFCPDEAQAHADLVVRGEAEPVLDSLLDTCRGVIDGRPVPDLDALPVPDLRLLGRRRGRLAPISTSRGCPYDCRFCAASRLFGRAYRFRCADAVIEELAVRVREGFRWVFFCDDNFAASRRRALELTEAMVRRRLPLRWSAQVRVEIADDLELLDLMKQGGCRSLFVGLESVNPDTLLAYRKGQTVEYMRHAVQVLRRQGFSVCGMFVVGGDDDDPETLEATLDFARAQDLTAAQFAILIPLPGTPLHQDLSQQGRIVDRDWSRFDGTHVVFRPTHFSRWALQRQALSLWRRFYDGRGPLVRLAARYLLWSWQRLNGAYLRRLRQEADDDEKRGSAVY